MYRCKGSQHPLVHLGAITVGGCGVLTEIVQSGEGFAAMTGKGFLASMFPMETSGASDYVRQPNIHLHCSPDVSSEMLASRKEAFARAVVPAIEDLPSVRPRSLALS